ncbi:MAG TPA: GGDEF domain-containing response regulator [Candidatus Acidoferrales bacterium]|nr:GGDEF domain-containing response regulator [Candidatus Acidoferrales bacterium]
MHILLVEDSPPDAKLVELMLQESDVKDSKLTHVDSFAKATSALRKGAFDVILLDLSLPDGSGLDLVNKLRATTMTPIVVLSGTGDEAIATMAVREGAQDYLVKGRVDEFLLSRSLRYAIERGTELKRMSTLAFYDALTGLQNRQSFMLSFEQIIGRAQRDHSPVACLFIDLDYFKEVNDRLGHQAGDHVLIVVAQILREAVRGSDIVGRLGGDEFVVVLSSIKKPADAAVVAEKIRRAIDRPVEVEGKPAHVSSSIGISFYPEDSEEPETLIHLADEAMYRAKHAGKNQVAAHTEHPARRKA